MNVPHVSVLLEETLSALMPDGRKPARVIDGTLGAGGHTVELLARGAGEVLGLDLDAQALAIARQRLASYDGRAHLQQASYADMRQHAHALGWHDGVDAILLDLGVSSMQVDTPERGFAFKHDAPLDMRFTDDGRISAQDIVNHWDERDLVDIFYRYGEEQHSRLIARRIVQARPITRTTELATLISEAVPKVRRDKGAPKGAHPATRVFQALRIAVNDELRVIESTLPQAIALLRPQGRLAVISFHSLEDRIVKDCFKDASTAFTPPPGMASLPTRIASVRLITKKPIEPSDAETSANPRARSAKLRVVEKL
jgi:16S rRNA (cytosine1402-N4)-methyltransferase